MAPVFYVDLMTIKTAKSPQKATNSQIFVETASNPIKSVLI